MADGEFLVWDDRVIKVEVPKDAMPEPDTEESERWIDLSDQAIDIAITAMTNWLTERGMPVRIREV